MRTVIHLFVLFISLFLSSCTPKALSNQSSVDWDSTIYLLEGSRQELQQYFNLLQAEDIGIYSVSTYDENQDEYEYSITVSIKFSKLLLEKAKSPDSLTATTKRLAYLVMSRVEYPYSYNFISISHLAENIELSTPGRSFEHSFFTVDLNLPLEAEDYEEEY